LLGTPVAPPTNAHPVLERLNVSQPGTLAKPYPQPGTLAKPYPHEGEPGFFTNILVSDVSSDTGAAQLSVAENVGIFPLFGRWSIQFHSVALVFAA
jgi:hypothetical protein